MPAHRLKAMLQCQSGQIAEARTSYEFPPAWGQRGHLADQGDLDITDHLVPVGAGAKQTILDADEFESLASARLDSIPLIFPSKFIANRTTVSGLVRSPAFVGRGITRSTIDPREFDAALAVARRSKST